MFLFLFLLLLCFQPFDRAISTHELPKRKTIPGFPIFRKYALAILSTRQNRCYFVASQCILVGLHISISFILLEIVLIPRLSLYLCVVSCGWSKPAVLPLNEASNPRFRNLSSLVATFMYISLIARKLRWSKSSLIYLILLKMYWYWSNVLLL